MKHIVVINILWKEVVCRSPSSQEEGKKGDLVGLLPQHTMLKTKELTKFLSLTQSKELLTARGFMIVEEKVDGPSREKEV